MAVIVAVLVSVVFVVGLWISYHVGYREGDTHGALRVPASGLTMRRHGVRALKNPRVTALVVARE